MVYFASLLVDSRLWHFRFYFISTLDHHTVSDYKDLPVVSDCRQDDTATGGIISSNSARHNYCTSFMLLPRGKQVSNQLTGCKMMYISIPMKAQKTWVRQDCFLFSFSSIKCCPVNFLLHELRVNWSHKFAPSPSFPHLIGCMIMACCCFSHSVVSRRACAGRWRCQRLWKLVEYQSMNSFQK